MSPGACSSARKPLALVAVGNPIAGDDGAGPEALRLLRERWGEDPDLLYLFMETDLFSLADHLHRADRFIFLDAMAGDHPGAILRSDAYQRGFAPSFHQADLGTVMRSLQSLNWVDPFPAWEAWGIVIDPPQEYRRGLSSPIATATLELVRQLEIRLRELGVGSSARECGRKVP